MNEVLSTDAAIIVLSMMAVSIVQFAFYHHKQYN